MAKEKWPPKQLPSCPWCEGKIRMVPDPSGKVGLELFKCDPCSCIIPIPWIEQEMSKAAARELMAEWNHDLAEKAKHLEKRAKRAASGDTQITGKVADLLKSLRTETDPATRRKLRKALRSAGHSGGLRG